MQPELNPPASACLPKNEATLLTPSAGAAVVTTQRILSTDVVDKNSAPAV
jgi:hypothetical protein